VIELFGDEVPENTFELKDSTGNVWKASEDIEIINADVIVSYIDTDGNTLFGSQKIVGNDIDGETPGDLSGHSVTMSSDGSRIVIGAIHNHGNGDNSGHVRVYGFKTRRILSNQNQIPLISFMGNGKVNSLCSKPLGSNGTPIITILKDEKLNLTPTGLSDFLVSIKLKLYYR